MKIAILTAGNSTDTGGIMTFVCEEARQLKKRESSSLHIDVYMIRLLPSRFLRRILSVFKKTSIDSSVYPKRREKTFEKDNVLFHNIWVHDNLISFIIRTRITHKPYMEMSISRINKVLSDYDYVITHKPQCHYVGMKFNSKYGIPYAAFWHGSEIGINAFSSKYSYSQTKAVLETAHDNFFVSRALLEISNKITQKGKKTVIYTGPSDSFYCYSKERKALLRQRFGLSDDAIVVGYAGHIIDLKNVMLLPPIFGELQKQCPNKHFVFWILGHGELENQLKNDMENEGISYTMFGNVPAGEMPDYMNCIDILVLISKKEGLGLVCLEAKRCGAEVFGSNAGGIPEVLGAEHCVALGDGFVNEFSNLMADYIKSNKQPSSYDEKFSWEVAVDKILQITRE